MKANELRIGNWVNDLGGNGIMQVDGLVISDIGMFNLQGIPLTPEILEQCGFEKSEVCGGYDWKTYVAFNINGLTLCLVSDSFRIWEECGDGYYSYYWNEIKTLHQLQNLFFAYSGTELEYNPIKETI